MKIPGGGINYLAIGNSITKHDIVNYWWSECGMAASKPDKDYFHLVTAFLEKSKENIIVCSYAYNFAIWENQATDRAETLNALDDYLNEDLNLITVQLGENASDLSTFLGDYEYLLNHIKTYCPKAQIIVIGDFWEYGERDKMKRQAAEQCDVQYVDLSEIRNEEFMAELGTSIYGDDGQWHKIEHEGVAKHPSDKGMEYIAGKIIEEIK